MISNSPISGTLRSEPPGAHRTVVVEEEGVGGVCRLEAMLAVLHLDDAPCLDRVGELEGLPVRLPVGFCLFGNEVQFQKFVFPLSVQVDVEVEADVPVRQLLAPDPDRFFDLRHILLR